MTTTEERPFWLTEAHAKWCRNHHTPDLHPDDQICWGDLAQVPMSLERPSRDEGLSEDFLVQLLKESPDSAPRVSIGINYASLGWHVTLDEAEALAATLTRYVEMARSGEVPNR